MAGQPDKIAWAQLIERSGRETDIAPQGRSRGQDPPRMRCAFFMAGVTGQNCLVSPIEKIRQGSEYSAAGELEGARPASNRIRSFFMAGKTGHKKRPRHRSGPRHPLRRGRNLSVCREHTTHRGTAQGTNVSTRRTFPVANGTETWHTVSNFAQGGAAHETQ